MKYTMEEQQLSKAEERAVERHRRRMCETWGEHVSYEAALDDWLENHAVAWREARQNRAMERQRKEMNKHRWLESEKAHCDLGKDAYIDWIKRYAAQWRAWYDEHADDPDDELQPSWKSYNE